MADVQFEEDVRDKQFEITLNRPARKRESLISRTVVGLHLANDEKTAKQVMIAIALFNFLASAAILFYIYYAGQTTTAARYAIPPNVVSSLPSSIQNNINSGNK